MRARRNYANIHEHQVHTNIQKPSCLQITLCQDNGFQHKNNNSKDIYGRIIT